MRPSHFANSIPSSCRSVFWSITAAREQAMKQFGLYERDNEQKPFYTPPNIIVIGVEGRGDRDDEQPLPRRPRLIVEEKE